MHTPFISNHGCTMRQQTMPNMLSHSLASQTASSPPFFFLQTDVTDR